MNGPQHAGQRAAQANEGHQIVPDGVQQLNAGVEVLDPVHRNLADPMPGFLRQHQQFRIEEPTSILHVGHESPDDLPPHSLESTLGIGETRPEEQLYQKIVAARQRFPLQAAGGIRVRAEKSAWR